MHSSPIDEASASRLDEEAAADALKERRTGVRSCASRMPVNLEEVNAVPKVTFEEITIPDRPIMEGIGPIVEAQQSFLQHWRALDGVWPMCDRTWLLFTEALMVAISQCPFDCHMTFANRLTELIDEIAWRQDDFEVVMDAQERLAAILHTYGPSRAAARQPLKTKADRLREWESSYGSLPVWMGLRSRSSRPRLENTACANFPSRLANLEHGWQNEVPDWHPSERTVPRSHFPSEVFYLVLFSGHRRAEDIASQVWGLKHGDRRIWPICLDMCLDPVEGNLLEARVQNFWKAKILDGIVIGMHASPPCETYTEARFLPLPPGQSKPRPLRSWSFPWCLPGLDNRELRQITVGNALYYVAIVFAAWLLVGWPFQCLGGQNEDGTWKTSRAKEVPPNLCRAIAEAVQTFSLTKLVDRTAPLSWPVLPDCVWQPFDPYATDAAGTRMGPDFWGWSLNSGDGPCMTRQAALALRLSGIKNIGLTRFISCFDYSTRLQRSWSIEAVHCVKVLGVMVIVLVVFLAYNMIFILAEVLLALQDHSGRYRWRKSLSSCLSGPLAVLLDQPW